MSALGIHCILELYGCSSDQLNNLEFIQESIKQACDRSKSTLLNTIDHSFDPIGITVVALLAESHMSIHTWPEHGYAAVDMFTCGNKAEPLEACNLLIERFQPKKHFLRTLERGAGEDINNSSCEV